MPDVHVPHLDAHEEHDAPEPSHRPRRGKTLLTVLLEVVLISAGVFLGLAGEQWRENARHRELAQESLSNFRTEILANRNGIAAVRDYHVATQKGLIAYFRAPVASRKGLEPHVQGIQPVLFEHTAWDLALATQSLAYTEPQLALALSRIYTLQQDYSDLTRNLMQALYMRPPAEGRVPFFAALNVYYADIVLREPMMMKMYDDVLPQLDRAIGGSPGVSR